MSSRTCSYVRQRYNVPAEIGRRVVVYGKPGIIARDEGHYIGVNFDSDRPGIIRTAHPTEQVEYGEMGRIRPMTRAQRRYQDYLNVADLYGSFRNFLSRRDASR